MENNFRNINFDAVNEDPFFEPSDQVWNGIEKELWPKLKRYFPVIWFGVTCFFLICGLYLYNDYLIVDHKAKPIVHTSSINNTALVNNASQMTPSPETSIATPSYQPYNDKSIALQITLHNGPSDNSNDDIVQVDPNIYSQNKPLLGSSSDNQESPIFDALEINKVKGIAFLPTYMPNLISEKYENFKPLQVVLPPKTLKEKKDLNLSFQVDQNLPMLQAIKYDEEALLKESKIKNWMRLSLVGNYKLSSSIELFGGVGYQLLQKESTHNLHIAYDLSSEIPGTNEHTNHFNHNINALGTDIATNLTLRRNAGTEITHNEDIHLELQTKYSEHHITIPIGVRYFPSKLHRYYFDIGISSDIVAYRRIYYTHVASHHSLVTPKEREVKIASNNRNISFNPNASLGYRIPIGSSRNLDLYGSYFPSVYEDMSTSSLSVGLRIQI